MSSFLLRDCVRLGISVFSMASGVVASVKKEMKKRVGSCLEDMGFVRRDEFEALSESLKRSKVWEEQKEGECSKRDQE